MRGRCRLKEKLLLTSRRISLLIHCCKHWLLVAAALCGCTGLAAAQNGSDAPYYARKNSFGILAAYSPDSSHILLGYAENRILINLGGSYSRRLFLNRVVDWQYDGELLPVALESDPVQVTVSTFTFTNPPATYVETADLPVITACQPSSGSGTLPGNGATYSYVATCTRRWTIGEGISPIGFQWNFLPRRKAQPFFVGHGGYMYSTQPIPINQAGSFNFTFDLGVGVELFRSHTRSIRGEFRYHHISNHGTATENPGIDNLMYQVTYVFGR
jgi:hypothetical protein